MLSKLIIVAALFTLACHCVYGRNTASNTEEEIAEIDTEERALIEVPLIGTVLMVAMTVIELVMNTIGPLFQYKLAAFALIANITSWLYQNYFSIIIGSVIVIGYCVISSTFAQEPEYEMDHRLIEAARQLEAGALKYVKMIN